MVISYPSLKDDQFSYLYYFSDNQFVEAVDTNSLGIHINTNVPDSFNLISGAGEIDIIPEISETFASKDFYYGKARVSYNGKPGSIDKTGKFTPDSETK